MDNAFLSSSLTGTEIIVDYAKIPQKLGILFDFCQNYCTGTKISYFQSKFPIRFREIPCIYIEILSRVQKYLWISLKLPISPEMF